MQGMRWRDAARQTTPQTLATLSPTLPPGLLLHVRSSGRPWRDLYLGYINMCFQVLQLGLSCPVLYTPG